MATSLKSPVSDSTGFDIPAEADQAYATVRRLESEAQLKARQIFMTGLALIVFAGLALIGAVVVIVQAVPHLEKTNFVMFEVEKATGIVRRAQTLDGPFNPDARTRNYFLRNVVYDFETYRADVNTRLERLRFFIPGDSGKKLYEEHHAKMVKLSKQLGDKEKRVISISPFSAITEHKSGQALNQSIADVTVEQETDSGIEILHLRVTIGYRFRGYTKEELESTQEEIVRRITENPLGMEVLEYYTELQVSPLKVERDPK